MSCADCESFQEPYHAENSFRQGPGIPSYPYRWKNANVLIMACEKHVLEIFEALNYVQEAGE